MPNSVLLFLFLFTIVLFFWGIHKALQTQNPRYTLALAPFLLLIAAMMLR